MPAHPLDELPATTGDAIFAAEAVKDLFLLLVRSGVIPKAEAADLIGRRLLVMQRNQPPWPGNPLAWEVAVDHLRELASDLLAIPDAPPHGAAPR
jgi:hypothetical protein